MELKKDVGIWIRVSTEDQAKGESPEHHEKRARHYAESKDWTIKEIYRLEAVSGKSVMEHPETKRMLTDIRSHKITGIIFSKLARLARNTKELLDFADIFRECDADLVSLQESIDTSTPAGRLFYTMIAAVAQWEREEIVERIRASVPIRAKLGKPMGMAPFGYQWLNKQLSPDPKEAPVRKLMYDLYLEHRRKGAVARSLNDAGYRTRNGSKFSDSTIGRLLRDSTAKGLHRANFTQSPGKHKMWKLKPQEEWIYAKVEPIVSEELWTQCNAILDEQQKKHRRPARRPVYLFTGVVYCTCGSKMYVPSNSPKYTCYACRTKIGVDDLESIFHEQLKTFLFSTEELDKYLAETTTTISEKEALLATLMEEKQKLKAEMDRILRLYLDGHLPKENFDEHYQPVCERHKQITNQLPELQGEIDFLKIQHLSKDEVVYEARDLHSRWPTLDFPEKRAIVEIITEKVMVGKDEVAINLCYLPASVKTLTESQRNL